MAASTKVLREVYHYGPKMAPVESLIGSDSYEILMEFFKIYLECSQLHVNVFFLKMGRLDCVTRSLTSVGTSRYAVGRDR